MEIRQPIKRTPAHFGTMVSEFTKSQGLLFFLKDDPELLPEPFSFSIERDPESQFDEEGIPVFSGLPKSWNGHEVPAIPTNAPPKENRNPVTVYFAMPEPVTIRHPERAEFQARITAYEMGDGNTMLVVRASDDDWPKLSKSWELLRDELVRLRFIDEQPAQVAGTLTLEYRTKLRENLAEHFNKDELRTLCFDLGIKYENFPEALDGMAREIVAYCDRDGSIHRLVEQGRRLRPHVSWEDKPE